jgi:hypothetical protein
MLLWNEMNGESASYICRAAREQGQQMKALERQAVSSDWTPQERLLVITELADCLRLIAQSNQKIDRTFAFDITDRISLIASCAPGILQANRAELLNGTSFE